ncbi:MAG: V-type ATP synthase subunit D [Gemmatimonadales bacterium]
MAREHLAPTRLNLLRGQRRLARLAEGASLLRRKREALVSELFKLARPAVDARAAIAARSATAWPALLRGLAADGVTGLRATAWPGRDVRVDIRAGQVWGIPVSDIIERPVLRRSLAARGTAPAGIGPAGLGAAQEFEALADLLLDAAPREMLLQRLGQALSQTSRQVNTLERRVAPSLTAQVARVRAALEEREREEHSRLRHVKRRRSDEG